VEFGHYDKALEAVRDGWYYDADEPQPLFEVGVGPH
jgi:hypothetical protein